jgi:hypothetical protein
MVFLFSLIHVLFAEKGDYYEGVWINDLRKGIGRGRITYENGDVYEGELNNEQREGIGNYTWKDGFFIILFLLLLTFFFVIKVHMKDILMKH